MKDGVQENAQFLATMRVKIRRLRPRVLGDKKSSGKSPCLQTVPLYPWTIVVLMHGNRESAQFRAMRRARM